MEKHEFSNGKAMTLPSYRCLLSRQRVDEMFYGQPGLADIAFNVIQRASPPQSHHTRALIDSY